MAFLKPKEVPDPPVIATGQVWRHRLSTTKSPLVRIDRIDMGESPPRVFYFRLVQPNGPKQKSKKPKLKLHSIVLPDFLCRYEYQPQESFAP